MLSRILVATSERIAPFDVWSEAFEKNGIDETLGWTWTESDLVTGPPRAIEELEDRQLLIVDEPWLQEVGRRLAGRPEKRSRITVVLVSNRDEDPEFGLSRSKKFRAAAMTTPAVDPIAEAAGQLLRNQRAAADRTTLWIVDDEPWRFDDGGVWRDVISELTQQEASLDVVRSVVVPDKLEDQPRLLARWYRELLAPIRENGAPLVVLADCVFGRDTNFGFRLCEAVMGLYPESEVLCVTTNEPIFHGPHVPCIDIADGHRSNPELIDACTKAIRSVQRVARRQEGRGLLVDLPEPVERLGLVGSSTAIEAVRTDVETAADSNAAVLIRGDAGTGKELVARAIHEASSRRREAMVTVNVAAIPPALYTTELMGADAGTHSAAMEWRDGTIHKAKKGTLFLDEIGAAPPDACAVLLRFLQNGEVQPLGREPEVVDVRVVSATNRAIEDDDGFPKDLFARLSAHTIRTPTLDERRDDIPMLLGHFLRRFNADNPPKVTRGAVDLARGRRWAGQVRELEQTAERLSKVRVIGMEHFLNARRASLSERLEMIPGRLAAVPFILPELLNRLAGNWHDNFNIMLGKSDADAVEKIRGAVWDILDWDEARADELERQLRDAPDLSAWGRLCAPGARAKRELREAHWKRLLFSDRANRAMASAAVGDVIDDTFTTERARAVISAVDAVDPDGDWSEDARAGSWGALLADLTRRRKRGGQKALAGGVRVIEGVDAVVRQELEPPDWDVLRTSPRFREIRREFVADIHRRESTSDDAIKRRWQVLTKALFGRPTRGGTKRSS